jgi:hypothetical protein
LRDASGFESGGWERGKGSVSDGGGFGERGSLQALWGHRKGNGGKCCKSGKETRESRNPTSDLGYLKFSDKILKMILFSFFWTHKRLSGHSYPFGYIFDK